MMMHVIEFFAIFAGLILMVMYWCVNKARNATSYIGATKPFAYLGEKKDSVVSACDTAANDYLGRRALKKAVKQGLDASVDARTM